MLPIGGGHIRSYTAIMSLPKYGVRKVTASRIVSILARMAFRMAINASLLIRFCNNETSNGVTPARPKAVKR
ncbi:hypothetical protein EVA_16812 [gut metagenome]|uniref:Uncharacterized protein n=1 Tax=gut metagenome TaxID=749906 RepID=J9FZY0_9ZZZZ